MEHIILILELKNPTLYSKWFGTKHQMTNTRADSLMELFKTNPDKIKELDINETRRLLANIAAGYDINSIEEEKISLIRLYFFAPKNIPVKVTILVASDIMGIKNKCSIRPAV